MFKFQILCWHKGGSDMLTCWDDLRVQTNNHCKRMST